MDKRILKNLVEVTAYIVQVPPLGRLIVPIPDKNRCMDLDSFELPPQVFYDPRLIRLLHGIPFIPSSFSRPIRADKLIQ